MENPNYASLGSRIASYLIDAIILNIIFFSLFIGFSIVGEAFVLLGGLLGFVSVIAYWIYFESHGGQTPGKSIVGIKVIMDNGEACTAKAAALRLLGTMVDQIGFIIPYLVGMLLIHTNDENKRIGDMIAHTIVVKE